MHGTHAFALHHVDSARRRVEQGITQVSREKIDLVHIQHATVRFGQQARL